MQDCCESGGFLRKALKTEGIKVLQTLLLGPRKTRCRLCWNSKWKEIIRDERRSFPPVIRAAGVEAWMNTLSSLSSGKNWLLMLERVSIKVGSSNWSMNLWKKKGSWLLNLLLRCSINRPSCVRRHTLKFSMTRWDQITSRRQSLR